MADVRETAKAEAERRYVRDEWTNGPGNRPVRFRSRAAEDAFVAGALWAWKARGEADAEAVQRLQEIAGHQFIADDGYPAYAVHTDDGAREVVLAAIRALDEGGQ